MKIYRTLIALLGFFLAVSIFANEKEAMESEQALYMEIYNQIFPDEQPPENSLEKWKRKNFKPWAAELLRIRCVDLNRSPKPNYLFIEDLVVGLTTADKIEKTVRKYQINVEKTESMKSMKFPIARFNVAEIINNLDKEQEILCPSGYL